MKSDAAMREYWGTAYEHEAVRLDNPSNRKQTLVNINNIQYRPSCCGRARAGWIVPPSEDSDANGIGSTFARISQAKRQRMDKGPGWRCCDLFGALKLWTMDFHMGGILVYDQDTTNMTMKHQFLPGTDLLRQFIILIGVKGFLSQYS